MFSNEGKIIFCFDPYDERINKIEERDNFIIVARAYELSVQPIEEIAQTKEMQGT